MERIRGPLWDCCALEPGGAAHLFTVAVGQGRTVFRPHGVKTWADTNMLIQGMPPAGWAFRAEAIEVEPLLRTPRWCLQAVSLQLVIHNRYFTALPASHATYRQTAEEVAEGLLLPGTQWDFDLGDHPLTIGAAEPFYVSARSENERKVVLRVSLKGTITRVLV